VPPDRISPYTGYTRPDWARAADRMLLAVRPFAADGHARIALPGRASAHGPGTGSTRNPAPRAARTTRSPGSLMPGLPASVTSATFSPRRNRSMISSLRRASLN